MAGRGPRRRMFGRVKSTDDLDRFLQVDDLQSATELLARDLAEGSDTTRASPGGAASSTAGPETSAGTSAPGTPGDEYKECVGCGISCTIPSPICQTSDCREWDYPDFKGTWDRHCANVARCKLVPAHGTLGSVETWLRASEEKRKWFKERVLAYYSLKSDLCFGNRVTAVSLEHRVQHLNTLREWLRGGGRIGVPSAPSPTLFFLQKAEVILGANPFILGGHVVPLNVDGKLSLVVSVPGVENACGESLLPENLSDDKLQSAKHVLGNLALKIESKADRDEFHKLFSEYHEHRMATNHPVPPQPSARPMDAGVTALALLPAGSPQGSPRGHPSSAGSQCAAGAEQEEETDKVDAKVTKTPPKKLSKVDKLMEEGKSKIAVLTSEDWEVASCDKNIEGLLKRVQNQKAKSLEECDTESSEVLSTLHASLYIVYNFGTLHKKMVKRKDASSLQALTHPYRLMKEDPVLMAEQWSPSLKILGVQVQFWSLCAEEMYVEAMKGISVDKVAQLFADSPAHSGNSTCLALQLVVPMIEKVLIGQAKAVKVGKKENKHTMDKFVSFYKVIGGAIPTLPKVSIEFPEKRRCELLADQVHAVATMVNFKYSEGGQRCVWPSAAKRAIALLMDTPKTRFAAAFETYPGGRAFVSSVQEMLAQSAHDHVVMTRLGQMKAQVMEARESIGGEPLMAQLRPALATCLSAVHSMAEMLPKMTNVAFEEIGDEVSKIVKISYDILVLSPVVIGHEINGAVHHYKESKVDGDTSGYDPDTVVVFSGGSAVHLPSLQKVSSGAKRILGLLSSWSGQVTNFATQLGNFLETTFAPKAQERNPESIEIVQQAKAFSDGFCKIVRTMESLMAGLETLHPIMIKGGSSRPWAELWQEWSDHAAANDPTTQKPYLVHLISLAKHYRTMVALCENEADTQGGEVRQPQSLQAILEWFVNGGVVSHMLQQHMHSRINEAMKAFGEASDLRSMRFIGQDTFTAQMQTGVDSACLLFNLTGTTMQQTLPLKGASSLSLDTASKWTFLDDTAMQHYTAVESLLTAFAGVEVVIDWMDQSSSAPKCPRHLVLIMCKSRAYLRSLQVMISAMFNFAKVRMTCEGWAFLGDIKNCMQPNKKASSAGGGQAVALQPELVALVAAIGKQLEATSELLASPGLRELDGLGLPGIERTAWMAWIENAKAHFVEVKEAILVDIGKVFQEGASCLEGFCPNWVPLTNTAEVDVQGLAALFPASVKTRIKAMIAALHVFASGVAGECEKMTLDLEKHPSAKQGVDRVRAAIEHGNNTIGVEAATNSVSNFPGNSRMGQTTLDAISGAGLTVPVSLLDLLKKVAGATPESSTRPGEEVALPPAKKQRTS